MSFSIVDFNGNALDGSGKFTAFFRRGTGAQGRQAENQLVGIPGSYPRFSRSDLSPRGVQIIVVIEGSTNMEDDQDLLSQIFEVGKAGALRVDFVLSATTEERVLDVVVDTNTKYFAAPNVFMATVSAIDPRYRGRLVTNNTLNITASPGNLAVTQLGNADEDQAIFTLEANTAKAAADAHLFAFDVLITNEVPRAVNNWALFIQGNGVDEFFLHSTEVGAGRSIASADDVRVLVDGVDVPRYITGANTDLMKIVVPWSMSPGKFTEVNGGAITAGSPATAGALTVLSTLGFPTIGALRIDDECILYNGLSTDRTQFLDIERGARGTTAGSHVDEAPVKWVERRVQIVEGHTGAVAADVNAPEALVPMNDLALSTNAKTTWSAFGDRENPGRPMTWARDISLKDTLATFVIEPTGGPDNVMDVQFSQGGAKAGAPNFNLWVREMPFGSGSSGGTSVQFLEGSTTSAITSKFEDPLTALPASANANDAAWSPDGKFLAIAHDVTPFVSLYRWTADGFGEKMADPGTLPAGVGTGVSWSSDGAFLAVSHTTTPFVTAYPMTDAGFGTKLADPSPVPAGNANDVKFAPDDSAIAVAHATTPFVTAYAFTTVFGAKAADPATTPTGIGNGLAWTNAVDEIVVAHDTSPFVSAYPWTGSFGTIESNPASLPDGNGLDVHFDKDDTEIVVAHTTTPFVSGYPWTGAFGTKRSPAAQAGDGNARGFEFSPNPLTNGVLGAAVANDTSDFLIAYGYQNGWGAQYKANSALLPPVADPAGIANRVRFSPSGQYLAVAHDTSPFITVYRWTGDIAELTASVDKSLALIGIGFDSQGAEQALSIVQGAQSAAALTIDEPIDPVFQFMFYTRSQFTNDIPSLPFFLDNTSQVLTTTATDRWQTFVAHGDGLATGCCISVEQDDATTRTYLANIYFDSTGDGLPDTAMGVTALNTATKSTAAREELQINFATTIPLQDGTTYFLVVEVDSVATNPKWVRFQTPYKEGAAETAGFVHGFRIISPNLNFMAGTLADDGAAITIDAVTLYNDEVFGIPYVQQQPRVDIYHLDGTLQNTALTPVQTMTIDVWVSLDDLIVLDIGERTFKNITVHAANQNLIHTLDFDDAERWLTVEAEPTANNYRWTEAGLADVDLDVDHFHRWI